MNQTPSIGEQRKIFLDLMNWSTYYEIEKKEEYEMFFVDMMNGLFTGEEEIKMINQNIHNKNKLNENATREEIDQNLFYVLDNWNYFALTQKKEVTFLL